MTYRKNNSKRKTSGVVKSGKRYPRGRIWLQIYSKSIYCFQLCHTALLHSTASNKLHMATTANGSIADMNSFLVTVATSMNEDSKLFVPLQQFCCRCQTNNTCLDSFFINRKVANVFRTFSRLPGN